MDTDWWQSIEQADRFFEQKDWVRAKQYYQRSINANPGEAGTASHEKWCRDRIAQIDKRLARTKVAGKDK